MNPQRKREIKDSNMIIYNNDNKKHPTGYSHIGVCITGQQKRKMRLFHDSVLPYSVWFGGFCTRAWPSIQSLPWFPAYWVDITVQYWYQGPKTRQKLFWAVWHKRDGWDPKWGLRIAILGKAKKNKDNYQTIKEQSVGNRKDWKGFLYEELNVV